jgi:hypothetical protein
MPAEDSKIQLPPNMTQEEFVRRVTERVWELWRREIEREQERQGKSRGR